MEKEANSIQEVQNKHTQEEIRAIIDSDPLAEILDIMLLEDLPKTDLEIEIRIQNPQRGETEEGNTQKLKFSKFSLVENKDPEANFIHPTSQIHLKLVTRLSNGQIFKEHGSQPNQIIKHKLLSPKFKTLANFFQSTIFSMKEKEICFIKVPKEIHNFPEIEDSLYYRVEIPHEKRTKGIAGQNNQNNIPKSEENDQEALKNKTLEILQNAKDLKDEANQDFKQEKIDEALEKWLRAKDDLRCLPKKNVKSLDEEEIKELEELKISIVNNILFVYKNQKEFGLGERLFLDSKKFCKNNIKFFMRYADILIEIGNRDEEARNLVEIFNEGYSLEKNEEFEKSLREFKKHVEKRIKEEKKKVNQRMTNGFRNFFGRKIEEMEEEEKIMNRMREREQEGRL